MLILAVDSSSDSLKIGLADQSRIYSSFDGPSDRSHSEKIIVELDRLLNDAGVKPPQIDSLAVVTGPGSFTGLRIGIATVLGLAEAWGKPILGAPTAQLAQAFFESRKQNPVVLFHCRARQFYVSDGAVPIYIEDWNLLKSAYQGRKYAGSGVEKLLKGGESVGSGRLNDPVNYTAGELAQCFARESENFKPLDPANLDVNYYLKSQPEQLREQASDEVVVDDMMPSDLPAIVRIESSTFSDPWTEANFRTDLTNSNAVTLVARRNGNCLGYLVCIAIDEYGYIANVAVDAAARSQGIGSSLLKELGKRLKQRKIYQMVLDVRISNIRAIKFYKEHGFTILTRRVGFYSEPPEDSYTMLWAPEGE